MISKDSIKATGWITLISMTTSVLTFLATHFMNGGNTPVPPKPLPNPDENVPIAMQKEYFCEAGSSIVIEPKFIGSIKWSVPPPFESKIKLFPFPNNEKVVLNVLKDTVGPIYVAANGAYQTKDGKYLPSEVFYVRINTVKGPGPTPGPTPNPNPPNPSPAPVLPDGKYKLAQTVYNSVMKNVEQGNRSVAAALATNYAGVRAKLVAGGYNSSKNFQQEILKDTTEGNKAALASSGVAAATWDTFFNDLQEVTYKLYTDRLLVTKEDFAAAWDEVSQGLVAGSK